MRERGFAVAGIVCAAVFAVVTWWVVASGAPPGIDVRIGTFFVEHRTGWATAVLRPLTWLGSNALLIPLVIAVGAWFWLRRHDGRPALFMAAALLGADLFGHLTKALVARERPPLSVHLAPINSASYPSGHAAQALACWGMVALLVGAGRSRRTRLALWAAASAIVAVVALSRLYLGVHWFTDVVGGLALGGLWLCVLGIAYVRWGGDEPRPTVP